MKKILYFLSSGDQIIKKGTTLAIFIYGIHHDETIFPNPDRFDPSRFEMNIEHFQQRSPYAYIPFSAGSRNCIGTNEHKN